MFLIFANKSLEDRVKKVEREHTLIIKALLNHEDHHMGSLDPTLFELARKNDVKVPDIEKDYQTKRDQGIAKLQAKLAESSEGKVSLMANNSQGKMAKYSEDKTLVESNRSQNGSTEINEDRYSLRENDE